MNRPDNVTAALCTIGGLLLALIMLMSSCTLTHRARRAALTDDRVHATLESYYITRENPENNRPGEQDSIKSDLRRQLRRK